MSTKQFEVVPLSQAVKSLGISAKTLREKARDGIYPSTVMRKVQGTWMVDIPEWNRWHRTQT